MATLPEIDRFTHDHIYLGASHTVEPSRAPPRFYRRKLQHQPEKLQYAGQV